MAGEFNVPRGRSEGLAAISHDVFSGLGQRALIDLEPNLSLHALPLDDIPMNAFVYLTNGDGSKLEFHMRIDGGVSMIRDYNGGRQDMDSVVILGSSHTTDPPVPDSLHPRSLVEGMFLHYAEVDRMELSIESTDMVYGDGNLFRLPNGKYLILSDTKREALSKQGFLISGTVAQSYVLQRPVTYRNYGPIQSVVVEHPDGTHQPW